MHLQGRVSPPTKNERGINMGRIDNYLKKLTRDDLLSLRQKICGMGASTDDRMLKNLMDAIEMEIIEIALVSYQRFSEDTIYHAVNALSNQTR